VNARVQHWTNALAGGGPVAALSKEEGALADVPNQAACMRAWNLWRSELSKEVDW
jgi:HCOMODA/2-hydroxy-3-carboxy-muconic semialdehyde decarboxylase